MQDKMADQLEQQEEINEFFAEKATEDKDELLDELNELTELDDLAELDGLAIGDKVVDNPHKNDVIQPKPAQPVQAKEEEPDEADLLNEMMAL